MNEIEKIKQKAKGEFPALIIDCSHGNSYKNPLVQPEVLKTIIAERELTHVRGVMLESYLMDGAQKMTDNMTYGQSVTDGCLGWEKTEQILLQVYKELNQQTLKLSA